MAAGSAFAAYITGNVASNLVGRLVSAGIADHFGLAANFYLFSVLNLAGAALVYATIRTTRPAALTEQSASPLAAWTAIFAADRCCRFGIGFCILFAFIGTFTYVNFVLCAAPFVRHDVPRFRLFRFPALRHHHTVHRQGGAMFRHPSDILRRAWAGYARATAPAAPKSRRRGPWSGAGWRGDLLRAGCRDGFCRPGRHRRSRFGERHLSGLLLFRRPCWHSGARTNLRSFRLGRVRSRHCVCACVRCGSRVSIGHSATSGTACLIAI